MITNKQRAYLRALGNNLDTAMQIGKEGLHDNSVTQINQMLEAKELVKVRVLPNCDQTPKEMATEICEQTKAECVQVVGFVILLYKRSTNKKTIHIVLPQG